MFDSLPPTPEGFITMAVLLAAGFYGPLWLGAKGLKRAFNGPKKKSSE